MTVLPEEGVPPPIKKIFKFDETTCKNDAVWKKIEEDEPDTRQLYSFCGVIVRILKRGVVLYVPLPGVFKVFVRNKYLRGSPLENPQIGQWMCVDAYERSPMERDSINVPRYSHMAVSKPDTFEPEEHLEDWKQRNFGGVFEFQLTVNLRQVGNVAIAYINKKRIYRVTSEQGMQVFVPCYRLDPILSVQMIADKTVRFWATRADYVEEYVKRGEKAGLSLYLLDFNPIDEILPDGRIRHLGSGKRVFSNEDDLSNSLPYNPPEGDTSGEATPISSLDASSTNGSLPTVVVKALEKEDEGPSREELINALEAFKHPHIQNAAEQAGLLPEFDRLLRWQEHLKTSSPSSSSC